MTFNLTVLHYFQAYAGPNNVAPLAAEGSCQNNIVPHCIPSFFPRKADFFGPTKCAHIWSVLPFAVWRQAFVTQPFFFFFEKEGSRSLEGHFDCKPPITLRVHS